MRGGAVVLDLLKNQGIVEDLIEGRLTTEDASTLVDRDRSSISRALVLHTRLEEQRQQASEWEMAPEVRRMLGHDLDDAIIAALDSGDGETFERLLTEMVDRFADEFRPRFFRHKRGVYITRAFHRAWIRAILKSIYTGGRILILSPPRHGKTELLVHFCVWLICRDFNITIIWIGGSVEIARRSVAHVKAQLESNDELLAAMLPPGESFRPVGRAGSMWKQDEFTIAQQDSELVKGSTMTAAGRGSRLLSLDADLIVGDDLEDEDSTAQLASRQRTRRWQTTQIESRKQDHTAYAIIGSRQHADDLSGHLLNDDEWESIVDTAHAEWCTAPWDDESAHTDCMLFPETCPFKWLRQKRRSAITQGLEGLFEMVYLNRPRSEGELVFVRHEIERAYNPKRGIGLVDARGSRIAGLPDDLRPIAGLDPSATGYQAGFLWAWSDATTKLYMIDLDNRHGGGIVEAHSLMKQWHADHLTSHWVVEENGFQKAILVDRDIKEWSARNGVLVEGHQTQGYNRNDDRFGVTSLVRLFRDGLIDLPFGTSEAREKTLLYVGQLLNFSTDTKRRHGVTDLVMASWFPMKHVYRWMRGPVTSQAAVDYDPVFANYPEIRWDGVF